MKKAIKKLLNALETGDIKHIQTLIAKKSPLLHQLLKEEKKTHCRYAIHYAAQYGQQAIIELLLHHYPQLIDIKDTYNQSPLLWAAANGQENIVRFLAEQQADVHVRSHNDENPCHLYQPIHWASQNGHASVVACLIEYGANPHILVTNNQSHLIHLAAAKGQLNVLILLLNKYPDLLNLEDRHHQTPLILASTFDHTKMVKYLLSCDANLNIAVNNPGSDDHGKTAVAIAIEKGYLETANHLILKINELNPEGIINAIKTGTQALHLMHINPALIDIFLANEAIKTLIDKTSFRHTEGTYQSYKRGKGKRLSYLWHYNTQTQEATRFKPIRELGEGSNGNVRLFKDKNNQCIAIKSPHSENMNALTEKQRQAYTAALIREHTLNKKAYAEAPLPSHLFLFGSPFSSRLTMPYISGQTADQFIPSIKDVHELATVTLKIAQELDRIHRLGIVHCDLSPFNIMIHQENNQYVVRIIDFGCAFEVDTTHSHGIDINSRKPTWYAPETRRNFVKPHSNQDIYSLGYNIKSFILLHPLSAALKKQFPCIAQFTKKALNNIPEERPHLSEFCDQLNKALNQEYVDTPSNCIIT